ncbi:energy transducer TonB [Chitinophaga sancti]|uniref:TonB protein C-terminal n=1 Tax=Chitinophaga sancti TaxID=1004 RepID=A0A1K1R444_9BACT|nr:hypothetical protein [Chitinophaga sancti]WQD64294.1 hypothetical protein U0033_07795 [Chitinophaga sancti]WQG90082.1 hypothetical protein SR876_01125 [Chitinophaga sancti]SFW66689.1 hypothetical protein SAMN05661012_03349 [Chitinophaga sancti]
MLVSILSLGLLLGVTGGDTTKPFVFSHADVPPSFPDLDRYIDAHLLYPPGFSEICWEGRVWVFFTIAADGCTADEYTDPKHSPTGTAGKAIVQAAIKFIQQMPAWKPGELEGKPVRTIVCMPLKFGVRE